MKKSIIALTVTTALTIASVCTTFGATNAAIKGATKIRSTPELTSVTAKDIKDGLKVEVTDKSRNFYKIKYVDSTTKKVVEGYVYESFVEVSSKEVLAKFKRVQDGWKKVGTYSTKFNVSDKERADNINKAAYMVSGAVYTKNGFSFNKLTGDSSKKENGWKEAGILVDGKSAKGIGGGICQVSSTMNAAVKENKIAGITVAEAKPHSTPVKYVSVANEAMINYGTNDFKVKVSEDFAFINSVDLLKGEITTVIYKLK